MDFLQRKALSAVLIIACGSALIALSIFLPPGFAAATALPGAFLVILGILEIREYRELSRIIEMGRKALKGRKRSA